MLDRIIILAAEEGGHEPPNPLIPKLSELIVGAIAFALLFWLLKKFALPMFEKTYQERTEAIEGGIKKAEVAQAEAAKALAEYQAALADARGEAAEIRAEAQSERTRIVEEARAEAQAAAEAVTARATAQIEADRAAAQAELSREVGRIALDLASRVVGETLEDDARARATVDRFIADLEASTAGGTEANGAVR
jgi:F-type H+-transporting ATPase subunit b